MPRWGIFYLESKAQRAESNELSANGGQVILLDCHASLRSLAMTAIFALLSLRT